MHCDNTKTSSEIEHVDWSTGTGSGHHYANVRFGSGSSQASQSSGDICRICHCESDPQNPLLTPCYCAGSLKYVHQACLQQWLTASETNACELCKFPFIMHTKIKPFNEWRSLDISGIERRRLCCSVLFHCAAALCVIWSLCVLIERAADDVKRGLIDWPFWTKLAVVTVGLTGGVVFMYIQCKAYLHLCHRWKARNRILLIQNAPEKIHALSPPSPTVQHRTHHEGSSEPRTSGTNAPPACSVDGPSVEVVANGASASNAYNYASATGTGSISGSLDIEGAATLHQHSSHHYHLPAEQHRVPQSGGGDADSDVLPTSHHHSHLTPQRQLGQVAVAANIECAQLQSNYERDWALDDVVSQISSFRPCPQGSGSMTPFHDSIHNVLEHSENSSRGSVNDVCGGSRQDLSTGGISTDTGREHALQLSSFSGSGDQKAPSISSGVSNAVANGLGGFVYKPHTKRYSNSSIFVENRDILTDSMGLSMESSMDYPAPNESYRHVNTLTPPSVADVEAESEQMNKLLTKDLRRYSDTKLVIGPDSEPMLGTNVDDVVLPSAVPIEPTYSSARKTMGGGSKRAHQLLKQHSASATDTILDMELPTSPLSPPAAYAANVTLATARQTQAALRRSLHTVDELGVTKELLTDRAIPSTIAAVVGTTASGRQSTSKTMFKSLPNLSGSCENLLRK
uniref:RING-type E3 ubiquitin transferase n=1 Tax=Ceratitis capitata TaxID=7213 RepID=W8BE95_CERCA